MYFYKKYGKTQEADKEQFVDYLSRRFSLDRVIAANLLAIAESEGQRTLFVPAEKGAKYHKSLGKALLKTEALLKESRNLKHQKDASARRQAKKKPIESAELAVFRNSLTTQSNPIVDSALAFMRKTAGDGLAVTETGLQAVGEKVSPESLSGTLARFCAAKNGVDQSSSIFAWAIGDACNLAHKLGYYRAGLYPSISGVTKIAVNHLKKMAHFSKIIPESVRIPGWPQSRYQQLVPHIRKLEPSKIARALDLIAAGDSSGRDLTLAEVRKVLAQVSGKKATARKLSPPKYLFITPSGLWCGNRFLPTVARNPRSRVVDLASLCVFDAAQEVLYRIRPACAETSRDTVMSLAGFAFDEEVLDEREKMA